MPADDRLAGGVRSSLAPGGPTLMSPVAGVPVKVAALAAISGELTAEPLSLFSAR